MPPRPARDAGFFGGTANRSARIADPTCCGALQQARANRGGRRTIPIRRVDDIIRNSLVGRIIRAGSLEE